MENIIAPDTIYLHITRRCNLQCAYCYFSAGYPMDNELTTEAMLDVMKDIHKLHPKRVVFTGGEPLLRKDIFLFSQTLRKLDPGVQQCIITNGTIIDEKNTEDVVAHFDEVRISLDGLENVNDPIRGQGTFKKAMKAFKTILQAGGDPIAFITVTALNISYLKNFMDFLLANKVYKIHLSPLKLVGRATDETMLSKFEDAKKIATEFWEETFGLRLHSQNLETFNCGVGRFLTLNPNGAVYPCHVLVFPEFCIGNVREQGLYSLYYESCLMNTLRNLHFSKIAQCAECFKKLLPVSEGACLGVCAQETGFREQLWNVLTKKMESSK